MNFLNRSFFCKCRWPSFLLLIFTIFFLFLIYGCKTPSENSSGNNQTENIATDSNMQSVDLSTDDTIIDADASDTEKPDSSDNKNETQTSEKDKSQSDVEKNSAVDEQDTGSEGQEITIQPLAPQIQLQIVSGPEYAQDNQVCFYRVIAHVAGEPFPEINFNKDDSGGAWGPNISQINLAKDQSFTLVCEASNSQGTTEASITVSWVENAEAGQANQTDAETQPELQIDYSNPADFFIDVNLSAQKVTVTYKGIELKSMVCSGGKPETPTPLGMFKTSQKIYYAYIPKFAQAAYYWTRFYGAYLFHSVPYDASGNLLTEELEKIGTPASHGCVRLYLEDAKWMYETLPLGINVSIHN